MQNQNLMPGVYYSECGEKELLNNLEQGIYSIANQNAQGFDMLAAGIANVDKKIRNLNRKERRHLICRGLTTYNGAIVVVNHYDDGSKEAEECILNAWGPWKTYLIKLEDINENEYFAIDFQGQILIVGESRKMNTSYFYELFIKNGIVFSSKYRRSELAKLLFEAFVPEIERTENVLQVSSLPGWHNGKYLIKENFPLSKIKLFGDLPVNKTIFFDGDITSDILKEYQRKIQSIEFEKDRVALTLFTYAGVISSLLSDASLKMKMVLNIVVCDKIQVEEIESYFRIYRNIGSQVIDGSMKNASLLKIFRNTKDSMFLVDFRHRKNTDSNIRKKLSLNKRALLDIVSGNRSFPNKIPSTSVVMISDSIIMDENAINLFWNNKMTTKSINEELKEKAVAVILKGFVKYIESNMENIQMILKNYKMSNLKIEVAVFTAVFEIVKQFWENYGVQFTDMLKLSQDFLMEDIFRNDIMDCEDLHELFVAAFRKHARMLTFIEKYDDNKMENIVRFDSEYIWIPSKVFIEFVEQRGLKAYLPQILLELKENKKIITDNEGFTRKLQVDKKRGEYYQFKRNMFNVTGLSDVINLGKEYINA